MEKGDQNVQAEDIINQSTPNWERDFPVVGKGTLIFTIQRNSPFFICIRPKLESGEPGADQWISLNVYEHRASLKMFLDGLKPTLLKEVRGVVHNESVGYEANREVSYWLSYDRDHLTLKYGKGYRMEETTLMAHSFLEGTKGPSEEEEIREKLQYLFSPVTRRRIEQYDVEPSAIMIQRYAERIKSQLKVKYPQLTNAALDEKSHEKAKSIIEIDHTVEFDKDPFVCNWSHLVLDSSKANLFALDSNHYTLSASLPPACLELYSNVTAQSIDLDWTPTPEKYRLSDAIRYSLKYPHGILHQKLQSKAGEFGSFEQTYLRVTLGKDHGNSPGIPYVLEIWPIGHGSPIHNHGNSFAVIRVLHGGLTIKIYNKHTDCKDAQPLQKFDVRKNDVTWLSPNWFQTHQLWNDTEDYCVTLQCYQYGVNDITHWPYFDYVADTSMIDEFLPNSDYTFCEMRDTVMKEFKEYMDG